MSRTGLPNGGWGMQVEGTIVVGGGLAGLAAAAALADRGLPVTVLESRPRLGGRASSLIDNETQTAIDNCQHVAMGCCTNFRYLCDRVGLSRLFRTERQLNFVSATGQIQAFRAAPLPAPFHLFPAFCRLPGLQWRDRLSIARGLRALSSVRGKQAGGTVAEWLRQHRQTDRAVETFWQPVLISALSESLDRIAVQHARKVFVDGFLANRRGWEVWIPTVPLEELYGATLTQWLEERGCQIQLRAGVRGLELDGNRVRRVRMRDGSFREAEQFVVAVPHHRLLSLLPNDLAVEIGCERIAEIESAPISSVHLWFDRSLTELPHAVLIGGTSQWMFNRGHITSHQDRASQDHSSPRSARPGNGRHYYQVVISASRDLSDSAAEVINEVVAELCAIWPAGRAAELVHGRLITEHRAVFSVTPGIDGLRPPQQTGIANLQLAGDWTRTGWPSTMEGAVKSGFLAAENVLKLLGHPQQVARPELSRAVLSRLLLGR